MLRKQACSFATKWEFGEAQRDITRYGIDADGARIRMAEVCRAKEAEEVAKHKPHMLDLFKDPKDGVAKLYKYIKGEMSPPTSVMRDGPDEDAATAPASRRPAEMEQP